jgi:NADPH2:quinone reductase
MKAQMKAIVIREFGGPEVLRYEDVPMPEPGPGEVVFKVAAVSVNRTLDLMVRAGRYARPPQLPHVLGADPTGTITAIGDGVTTRKVGDRVATSPRVKPPTATEGPLMLGVHVWGGYAQYVRVPATGTHLIPNDLGFPAATVVARHAPLAFNLLRDKARIQAGEWVLVMGAAGGLGSAGVQAAKYLGARIIAAAGADERVDVAVRLGADFGVNYRAQDLTAEVRRLTDGRGVDVVFENIGDAELFPKAFASLARNGRLVTAGGHAGGLVPLDINRLYMSGITVMGSTVQTDADVDMCLKAAAEGRFDLVIDRILPLSEAALAHQLVADRAGLGKVLLAPED